MKEAQGEWPGYALACGVMSSSLMDCKEVCEPVGEEGTLVVDGSMDGWLSAGGSPWMGSVGSAGSQAVAALRLLLLPAEGALAELARMVPD